MHHVPGGDRADQPVGISTQPVSSATSRTAAALGLAGVDPATRGDPPSAVLHARVAVLEQQGSTGFGSIRITRTVERSLRGRSAGSSTGT